MAADVWQRRNDGQGYNTGTTHERRRGHANHWVFFQSAENIVVDL